MRLLRSFGCTFAQWYSRHLAKRPLLVKSVTSGGLVGLSDALSQVIRNCLTHCKKHEETNDSASVTEFNYNYKQTFWMAVYGAAFVAPFAHSWYGLLDRAIAPLSSAATTAVRSAGVNLVNLRLAARRALVDQLSVGPIFNTGFFVSRGLIAGKSGEEIENKMRADFLRMTSYGLCLWVPAQFVNFLLVPLNYRVLYINLVGLSWSTFSNLKVCYDMNTLERESARKNARKQARRVQLDEETPEERITFAILYAEF